MSWIIYFVQLKPQCQCKSFRPYNKPCRVRTSSPGAIEGTVSCCYWAGCICTEQNWWTSIGKPKKSSTSSRILNASYHLWYIIFIKHDCTVSNDITPNFVSFGRMIRTEMSSWLPCLNAPAANPLAALPALFSVCTNFTAPTVLITSHNPSLATMKKLSSGVKKPSQMSGSTLQWFFNL